MINPLTFEWHDVNEKISFFGFGLEEPSKDGVLEFLSVDVFFDDKYASWNFEIYARTYYGAELELYDEFDGFERLAEIKASAEAHVQAFRAEKAKTLT